jgi:hypothetical protein
MSTPTPPAPPPPSSSIPPEREVLETAQGLVSAVPGRSEQALTSMW